MRLLTILIPLALCTALPLPAVADDALPGTISIEGHGEVVAAPDAAFITSGVTSQGATARAALDANTLAMNELITTLKAAGIEAKDIQTSGFSVNPNYVYTDARDENGYTLPPKINGYQVYNTVTVRVRDLPALGTVLDKAVTVGANTINGVSFSVADPSQLYDEARKSAFADARAKAELYAAAAGVELASVRAINESQGYARPPQPYMMEAKAMDGAASSSVPVEAGELTFAINVLVTWELSDDN